MKRITADEFQREMTRIIDSLKAYRPHKVILFGSFARGDYHAMSDVDLLIIKSTNRRFVDRIGDVLALCDRSISVEPLVYTPVELARMLAQGNTFLETALREGNVVYDETTEGLETEAKEKKKPARPGDRNREEALRWLRQSEYDLQAAQLNHEQGFHALSCFLCQQVAEKALKAFLYAQGERMVRGHATHELVGQCTEYQAGFAALHEVCAELDQYYIPTRYPNSLPGGIPHEVYTGRQAARALDGARQVLDMVTRQLHAEEKGQD